MKKALITGITGQDGSYLAELLLDKGYEVHGIVRRSSNFGTTRIDHVFDKLILHYGDMGDAMGLLRTITEVGPDEVYNLAAQSHVKVSFEQPAYTANVTGVGASHLLEAVRLAAPWARFYQASSSEMFGGAVGDLPYTEESPFNPKSPYAIAKVFAHHEAVMYREAYGMHVSCGILFNHESPRRGETFVTRKITKAAGRIAAGKQKKLVLGNVSAARDWGFAKDYVEAMWLMLQQDSPDDFVIATGESHTVEEFLDKAFWALGLNPGVYVETNNERYMRPKEVHNLCGDAAKARRVLGWKPKTTFNGLVNLMVRSDIIYYEI